MPARTAAALLAATLTIASLVFGVSQRQPAGAAVSTRPRVSFVAAPGSTILVHGSYPKYTSPCANPVQPIMHARFEGTIEVGLDTDGSLFVIGVLPFEDYLKGIAEVPRSWPDEALKAQVVAARSYALAHMAYPDPTGDALGYDLCATTACQVYTGLAISNGPYGDRWVSAVEETAGQALLYNDRPADTLYSSTSNGKTLSNHDVFGTTQLPYLKSVKEKDDGESPVSHWHAEIPFDDLARFLSKAGDWGNESISSVSRAGSTITLKGGGATDTLSVTDFRIDLNYWAHCLDPDHYPSIDTDGSKLPQTVPSKWFDLSTAGSSVVLDGRGWGHGVGMVQWGAYGKAARGMTYDQILAYYYGGLQPTLYPAEPAVIRIGIATGLNAVRVEGTGDVTQSFNASDGPWLIKGGKRLHVTHSHGPPTYFAAGAIVHAPKEARSGADLAATVSVERLSVVSLLLRSAEGVDYPVTEGVTTAEGEIELSGTVPPMPTGTYSLIAVTTDGVDIVDSNPTSVHVVGLAVTPTSTSSPSPSGSPPAESSGTNWALYAGGGFAAVAAVATVGLVVARRRRRMRGSAWQETRPPPSSAP